MNGEIDGYKKEIKQLQTELQAVRQQQSQAEKRLEQMEREGEEQMNSLEKEKAVLAAKLDDALSSVSCSIVIFALVRVPMDP